MPNPDYFKPPPGEKPVLRILGDVDLSFMPQHVSPNVSTHEPGTMPGCPLCQSFNARKESCDA